jgi:anti-sigma factor RsiW
MNCEEAIALIDGYLDGELDAITNQEIERHLRDCSACAQAYESQREFIRSIAGGAPYYRAPADLRQSIQAALRQEIPQHPIDPVSKNPTPIPSSAKSQPKIIAMPQWSWLALAAALIAAAVVAVNVMPRQSFPGDQFLATELIAGHVRSLMANHLTDIASSDQHTVKPWLDTKLDFAPAVFDLTNEGFPLIGGRLDYIQNRPAAALVYQRRKHFINLFIWPVEATSNETSKPISRQGFQLLHWTDSDFSYWAVSDVSMSDLQLLQQQFEAQSSHR